MTNLERFQRMNQNIEPNTAKMYFNGRYSDRGSGQTVNLLPKNSDGATPSLPTNPERRTTPHSLTQKWVDDEAPLPNANQNNSKAMPALAGDADEQIGWVQL